MAIFAIDEKSESSEDILMEDAVTIRDGKIFYNCDLCGSEYQFGPHVYAGHYLFSFKLNVCKRCVPRTDSPIPALYEAKFLKLVKKKGLDAPTRNADQEFFAFPESNLQIRGS